MSFRMILYQNTAEANRVDKSEYLVKVYDDAGVVGTLREGTSIINPVILFEFDGVPQFNYVQIGNFNNRFYFVNDIVSVATNLWEVYLSIDVLHTYRSAIRSCFGYVERNEFSYDPLINDNRVVVRSGQEIIDLGRIANYVFTDGVGYILTGCGIFAGNEKGNPLTP